MSISDAEAKELIKNMINGGFGMIEGEYHSSGREYYKCSCCFEKNVLPDGVAAVEARISDVKHDPNCNLVKLAEWSEASTENEPHNEQELNKAMDSLREKMGNKYKCN